MSTTQQIIDQYKGGSLDLSGCDLKGVTLPSTVSGSLDLSGCDLTGVTLPNIVYGKPSKLIAFDGYYALFAHDDGTYSAGCQKHLSQATALAHWARDDARAKLFTNAILSNTGI